VLKGHYLYALYKGRGGTRLTPGSKVRLMACKMDANRRLFSPFANSQTSAMSVLYGFSGQLALLEPFCVNSFNMTVSKGTSSGYMYCMFHQQFNNGVGTVFNYGKVLWHCSSNVVSFAKWCVQ